MRWLMPYWLVVESSWNLMAHGDAWEGKWRRNWWMEWVASTLTPPQNVVYQALVPLMSTPRLSVVDWTDAPANLNGLVHFRERPSPVSARVPSHFKRSLAAYTFPWFLRHSQYILSFTLLVRFIGNFSNVIHTKFYSNYCKFLTYILFSV